MSDSKSKYALYADKHLPSEWERLDEMHEAVAAYIGHSVSFGPLGSPRKILEIGAGSGAWSIQAAQEFPDAEITAIDISPLPDRPLPPNVKYQTLDISQPVPFEPETFDLIHARLVFLHLHKEKSISEIYPRVTSLLAPNGILLVEDADIVGNLDELTPGMQRCMSNLHKHMISNGQDPAIARYIAGNMVDSGAYDKMRVDNCEIPLNPSHETAEEIANLGRALCTSFTETVRIAQETALDRGSYNSEARQGWLDDVESSGWKYSFRFYALWARKQRSSKSL